MSNSKACGLSDQKALTCGSSQDACLWLKKMTLNSVVLFAASFTPYPYNPKDYLKVCLGMVVYSQTEHMPSATIVLNRLDEHGDKEDLDHALLLQIAGESVNAISTAVLPPDKAPASRPLALDLLWKVRQLEAQQQSQYAH